MPSLAFGDHGEQLRNISFCIVEAASDPAHLLELLTLLLIPPLDLLLQLEKLYADTLLHLLLVLLQRLHPHRQLRQALTLLTLAARQVERPRRASLLLRGDQIFISGELDIARGCELAGSRRGHLGFAAALLLALLEETLVDLHLVLVLDEEGKVRHNIISRHSPTQ